MGCLKPLVEAPRPSRLTNGDVLRRLGLSSSASTVKAAQTNTAKAAVTKEKVEGVGGKEDFLALPPDLSFTVFPDDEADGVNDGEDKGRGGDGGSAFANGLSFHVYQDEVDEAAGGSSSVSAPSLFLLTECLAVCFWSVWRLGDVTSCRCMAAMVRLPAFL